MNQAMNTVCLRKREGKSVSVRSDLDMMRSVKTLCE